MGEFKTIETQEQFDEALKERLKRERESVKKEYEGFLSPEQVAEKYKDHMSPEDVAAKYKDHMSPDKVAELQAKIKGYETDSVKTRIAHETGLTYDAVQYLSGDDEESIRKSAAGLKNLMGSADPAPLASTEETVPGAQEVAYRNTLKSLKGE